MQRQETTLIAIPIVVLQCKTYSFALFACSLGDKLPETEVIYILQFKLNAIVSVVSKNL